MMRAFSSSMFVASLALVLIFGTACPVEEVPDGTGNGAKEGESCTETDDCDVTLYCAGAEGCGADHGTCQHQGQPGTQKENESCASNGDCLFELVCSAKSTCSKRGDGAKGDACVGHDSCGEGLVCSGSQTCSEYGEPGTACPDDECEKTQDCGLGLMCYNDKCTPLANPPGVACSSDSGPLRAFFEIPRGGVALSEFYRMPFPNDFRIKDGNIDLDGHYNPGVFLPPEFSEIVGDYLEAIEEDVKGFGVNTSAFIRMSRTVDFSTLTVTSGDHGGATVKFVNIDKESSNYGNGVSLNMVASSARGRYICDNWISVKPKAGYPLEALTTYAVMLTEGIKDDDNISAVQDDDFKIVMSDTEPDDADEKAAWEAYAPFRQYLDDEEIERDSVLTAAVFTTMDPRAKMSKFREVVRGETIPNLQNLTLCDGTALSPCEDEDDETRNCPTAVNDGFHELHGTYKTPVFQTGTAPYKTSADGGAIQYDEDGNPEVTKTEDVCTAISVPKGEMPQNGWPVVIYAHGTGGNYRSFITNGTAENFADIEIDGTDLSKLMVIGIDGGMHGPRRNSDEAPDGLFFNLGNPRAARDNVYQAVADKYQLMRLLEGLNISADDSPTGEAITIDPTKVYFWGHSQGSVEGIPFVSYESGVRSVLLSGAGGYLLSSFEHKTKPINIAAGVRLALAESNIGSSHPLLNLLQLFFEEVDSVNYGRAIFSQPIGELDPKHAFLVWGIADNYTPPITEKILALSMRLKLVNQPAERCGDGQCFWSETCDTCSEDCPVKDVCKTVDQKMTLIEAPVSENVTVSGKKVTAATVQYVSDGSYDDHFVIFQNDTAAMQSTYFLGSDAKEGVPTIPVAE